MGAFTSDKQAQLSGFLRQLPENVARRLAKAIEVDRLMGGKALPHDLILRGLRPQLRRTASAERMGSPLRYFCLPFEDLLVNEAREEKQKGRIARSSINAVWNWLANDVMPERHSTLCTALTNAVVNGDASAVAIAAGELHREAAAALSEAIVAGRKKAIAALGDALVLEDVIEIALLLGAAEEIAAIQKRLRKPVLNFTEDDVQFLREMFHRLSQDNGDLAPYFGLIVMARLERPWEALRFVVAVSHSSNDAMIANTDIGIVGELLLNDLDSYVRKIQAIRVSDVDADTLLVNLEAFAELSAGVVKELAIRRDGKWGQQLAKGRAAVAKVMESIAARCPRKIMAGLPGAKSGVFAKGPRGHEMTQPVDPERIARALRYARVLVQSKPFAAAAAFSAKLGEAIDEAGADLRNYSEDLLRELRQEDPAARAVVEKHFALLLDLYTLILGTEEASFLRRRARIQANG